jgi:metallo-beta-lactamase family protein
VSDGVEIRFVDAGHLLGSACIEVFMQEGDQTRKMVFSGDLGSHNRPILKNPQTVKEADYVMVEATYGNRLHKHVPHAGNHVALLTDILNRTFSRGGNVVIPSFAVGRTQEILYDLREIKEKGLVTACPDFKVYMDSPLAGEATRVFMQCGADSMDGEAAAILARGVNPFWFEGLVYAESSEASKAINADSRPKVIISASGMCEAGRIRHHLKHNLWRKESTILFVGYQTAGTLGRTIWEGAKSVSLFGEEVAVRAEICTLSGISGHADRRGLQQWLKGFVHKPRAVFVNHGDEAAVTAFADLLGKQGYTAYAPHSGTVYDLLAGKFQRVTRGVPVRRAAAVHAALVRAAEDLLDLVKKGKRPSQKEQQALTDRIRALIAQYKK